jgi:hypothetical protein
VRQTFVLVIAAAALLCIAGGAYAHANGDQALAVAVDGPGQVNGTGIACRDGSGDCVELYADGTSVTLTAVSDAGATFAGWGGDCTASETNATCTVTMSSARAVTATFTAGGGAGNPTLTVSASGNGKVTGNGINCGAGTTDCTESYSPGTVVALTETPDMGATFSGWGGACSATATTCNVTMNSSQTVTASFTGGSSGNATLTVRRSGNGKITGSGGIACGAASTVCSENYTPGTTVTLTAVPNSGAAFLGWGGDCVAAGTNTTCTVTMSTSKNATASFSAATGTTFSTRGPRAGSTFAVHSNGTPLVARTSVGWAVTLRFFTSRSAGALLRLSRTGRAVHVFTFSPRAGNVLVGPFNVPRSGKYRFQMTLSDGHGGMAGLTWNLCLGACARSRSAS